MNATEGLMRIAIAVRWIGYLIAGLFVVVAMALTIGSSSEDKYVGFLFLIPAVIFGGGGWVLGWIIEGFGKPKE